MHTDETTSHSTRATENAAQVAGYDLKTSLRDALAGSSSRKPVDVSVLYKLGGIAKVQAALLEMYRSREAYCCLTIKAGQETSVWWLVGVPAPHSYGRTGRSVSA